MMMVMLHIAVMMMSYIADGDNVAYCGDDNAYDYDVGSFGDGDDANPCTYHVDADVGSVGYGDGIDGVDYYDDDT